MTTADAREHLHDPQHPGDAGPLARRHQRPDRFRLRRAEPRPAQRISLHLPGRRPAAHRPSSCRRRASRRARSSPRCAGCARRCRPSCRSPGLRITAVGNDVAVRDGALAVGRRLGPAADGLRGRAGAGHGRLPAARATTRRAGATPAARAARRCATMPRRLQPRRALEASDRRAPRRRIAGARSTPTMPTPISTSARCCAKAAAATRPWRSTTRRCAAIRTSRCCTSTARSRSRTGPRGEALASYDACLRLAPDLADAHYNAARLHEQLGDAKQAVRHFSAYRRLQRPH